MSNINSHNKTWGCVVDTNDNGEVVDKQAEDNELSLIRDTKLPRSFNSGK